VADQDQAWLRARDELSAHFVRRRSHDRAPETRGEQSQQRREQDERQPPARPRRVTRGGRFEERDRPYRGSGVDVTDEGSGKRSFDVRTHLPPHPSSTVRIAML
jgi:hypothetical protein